MLWKALVCQSSYRSSRCSNHCLCSFYSLLPLVSPIYDIVYIFSFLINKAAAKDEGSSGTLKYLGEYFQRYPENRCSSTDQCTQQVLKGSSVHIFVNRKFKQNWLSNSQLFHFISNQFNFILLRFLDHRFSSVYNRWRPEKEWEMSFDSGQRNFYAGATISFHITEK